MKISCLLKYQVFVKSKHGPDIIVRWNILGKCLPAAFSSAPFVNISIIGNISDVGKTAPLRLAYSWFEQVNL